MGGAGEPVVALVYDDDAYVEAGGPMGRQVAGRSFLDAYLAHGNFSGLAALVRDRGSAASLVASWRGHSADRAGTRTLRVMERAAFHRSFFPTSPAAVIHWPQPPDPCLAWARQQAGSHAYALTGVTHTLCSAEAVALLRELVTAPFESYDALVCTSRAVVDMVREVTGSYAEYLRSRFGGSIAPERTVRMATIPLGVDVDRFRPPSPGDRAEARGALGVDEGEVVVLYVGRLSHHAKAHPFPLFRAAEEAARTSERRVHLILAGWAAHPAIHDGYLDGARKFAPNVRTSLVDGREPHTRRRVWLAADLFVSPSDNVQETFGLAILEAMSSGLPVVASDWDGYRDLVVDGQTGFLVPTRMVEGATAGATARLLTGELSYDHFLAECSQATAVDSPAMAAAVARLVADEPLRRRMGGAGRRRALDQFAWPLIIRAYERLWHEQDAERRERAGARASAQTGTSRWCGPAAYPAPERSFARYPTGLLDSPDRLVPSPGASDALDVLLAMPLAQHAPGRRVPDAGLLRSAIDRAPCSVADIDHLLAVAGVDHGVGRATIAWMLKYDLLRVTEDDRPAGGLSR
jgi:glycosyltransferase involved in cell wall biosynthesis